jgi:hypothetical protein
MATDPARDGGGGDDDRPPFAGSWRGVYALVLGALALLIVLCSVVAAVYR